MKRNRVSTWFQSTIYVQEKGHEDSEMQMTTDGSKLGSPAQDSWATIVASKKRGRFWSDCTPMYYIQFFLHH